MRDETDHLANDPAAAPLGDAEGIEGGKTAPGDATGSRGQLDAAGGGYGSESGTGTSGGTGDGDPAAAPDDPGAGSSIDDGTTSGATGAQGEGPTEWLRGA
jgi:hypothetical protein